MFMCDFCSRTIGPKVSPIQHVFDQDIRLASYTNRDAEGELKVSHGSEVVKVFKKCPECAALSNPNPKRAPFVYDHKPKIALGLSMQVHAKGCKKHNISDCLSCTKAVNDIFPSLSLPAIAVVMQETKIAPTYKASLAALAVENYIDRTRHKSKRAKADVDFSYKLLKGYQKRGGSL